MEEYGIFLKGKTIDNLYNIRRIKVKGNNIMNYIDLLAFVVRDKIIWKKKSIEKIMKHHKGKFYLRFSNFIVLRRSALKQYHCSYKFL